MESTITEHDMDATTKQFVGSFKNDSQHFEPDLSVDGLSESLVSRLIRILSFGRAA
ncbi:MAG TPA: hypothetical protein VKZ91_09270 [Woeseiaceae bacterium]|nr:hypothetical protein [Woeseiaceae bacterium]